MEDELENENDEDEKEFEDADTADEMGGDPKDEDLYQFLKTNPQAAAPKSAPPSLPQAPKEDDEDEQLYKHLLKSKFDPKSDEYKEKMNERSKLAEDKQNQARLFGIFGSLANNRGGLTMYGQPIGGGESHAGDAALKQAGDLNQAASTLRSPDTKEQDQALYQYLRDKANDKRMSQLAQYQQGELGVRQQEADTKSALGQAKAKALAAGKKNADKEANDKQLSTASAAEQMNQAEANLKSLTDDPKFEPTSNWDKTQAEIRNVPILGPMVAPALNKNALQYDSIQKNWTRNYLIANNPRKIAATDKEVEMQAKQFFPQPGDTPEEVQRKNGAREIANNAMKARSGKGYNAGAINNNLGTPEKPPLDPKDQQALDWVESNPNDPRAKAVMEKLKAKGIANGQ